MGYDMLSSKGEWKVLGLFLEQPWERFYLREIIKKAGISPNTAVNASKEMEMAGILSWERIGNAKVYRLVAGSEVSKKLLMLHHEKRLQSLSNEFKIYISRLRAKLEKKDVASLVLFGSVSKGLAKPESDIDILVITERKMDKNQISSIFKKYSRYVQVIMLKRREFEDMYKKGNELLINILKSGTILYDRDFYSTYLFRPIPKPSKVYIEGILKDVEKRIEALWEMYRKKEDADLVSSLLHTVIYRLSVTLILLNRQIPESKNDVAKKLSGLKQNKLSRWFSVTKRIWDGEGMELSKNDIEKVLNLLESKIKECYVEVEKYHD